MNRIYVWHRCIRGLCGDCVSLCRCDEVCKYEWACVATSEMLCEFKLLFVWYNLPKWPSLQNALLHVLRIRQNCRCCFLWTLLSSDSGNTRLWWYIGNIFHRLHYPQCMSPERISCWAVFSDRDIAFAHMALRYTLDLAVLQTPYLPAWSICDTG